jgi:transcriptional regulator with XRE-family HTH domain
MAYSALGEFIRQQRKLADLSMRQFAELAGISNPYLSQIERGLRAPSEQVVDSIASALKLSADALYTQAGMTPPGAAAEASGVLKAIAEDRELTTRQKAALREVYQSFVGARRKPRRGARGARHRGGRRHRSGDRRATGRRRLRGAGGRPKAGPGRTRRSLAGQPADVDVSWVGLSDARPAGPARAVGVSSSARARGRAAAASAPATIHGP